MDTKTLLTVLSVMLMGVFALFALTSSRVYYDNTGKGREGSRPLSSTSQSEDHAASDVVSRVAGGQD